MNRLGNQFLAGSALTLNEDTGHAGRKFFNKRVDFPHFFTLAGQSAETVALGDLFLEPDIFLLESPFLQGVFGQNLDFFNSEGLGNIIIRSELHGLDGLLGGRERGYEQHRRFGRNLFDLPKEGQSVEPGMLTSDMMRSYPSDPSIFSADSASDA